MEENKKAGMKNIDNNKEGSSMKNTLTVAGNTVLEVTAEVFSLDLINQQTAVAIVSPDTSAILAIQRKGSKTKMQLCEDYDEIEFDNSNNILNKVLGEEPTTTHNNDNSVIFDSSGLDAFCNIPERLHDLVEVSLKCSNFSISPQALLDTILVIAQRYSVNYIMDNIITWEVKDIAKLVESNVPLDTFIELTS